MEKKSEQKLDKFNEVMLELANADMSKAKEDLYFSQKKLHESLKDIIMIDLKNLGIILDFNLATALVELKEKK